MNELKFRVWDGEKMILPEHSQEGTGSSVFVLLMDMHGKCSWNNPYGFHPERQISKAHVMPYTGLKDFPDKESGLMPREVAVGDILKHNYGSAILDWIVCYSNGCIGIRNLGSDRPQSKFFPSTGESFFIDRHIVGNIHENPEMLNWE